MTLTASSARSSAGYCSAILILCDTATLTTTHGATARVQHDDALTVAHQIPDAISLAATYSHYVPGTAALLRSLVRAHAAVSYQVAVSTARNCCDRDVDIICWSKRRN